MKIFSSGIVHGQIADRFGKYGDQISAQGVATRSLPVRIEDAPAGTQTFALVLEDKDAIPVCGFSWLHWVAANIRRTELQENESLTATDFVQGATSASSPLQGLDRMEGSRYCGMAPPDKPHTYELHVYALDCALELELGFYMNELYWKMQGHVLDQCTLAGVYRN